MSTERERKEAYGAVADAMAVHWPGISRPGWSGTGGVLLEVKRIHDAMRAASEVPLSPTGEAELEHALRPEVAEFVASLEDPGLRSATVRPVASRSEEVVGRDHSPSPGQGPAAVEGPPPAPVFRAEGAGATPFCNLVMAWVLGGFPGSKRDREVQSYRDHLRECASCSKKACAFVEAEKSRETPDGRP